MRICSYIALALVAAAGCGQPGASQTTKDPDNASHGGRRPAAARIEVGQPFKGSHPIGACCTTGMVADVVRNVAGPHVRAAQLMGEGVDPHLYKTSPGDITQLSRSDIIFYSGLHLEGKMADLFVRMARLKPTFAVTEYIEPSQIMDTSAGSYDPHVWFDVSLWSQTVDVVRDVLVGFDPKHAATYRKNAKRYRAELAELHQYAKTQIVSIPKPRRVLVTAHDAFRYFGRAYDMEVRGIQGISTESEAGVLEINQLVQFIADRKIKAVFVESSVSEDNVRALVEGCQARGHQVVIGGQLYSDAMGAPGTDQGTYVGMVRHNVDTITRALR